MGTSDRQVTAPQAVEVGHWIGGRLAGAEVDARRGERRMAGALVLAALTSLAALALLHQLAGVLGATSAGAFVAVSTDRLAQSVSLTVPGYLPDDNWFHLAPGRPKIIRLHPFGERPERIEAEIRQLGSSGVIHV